METPAFDNILAARPLIFTLKCMTLWPWRNTATSHTACGVHLEHFMRYFVYTPLTFGYILMMWLEVWLADDLNQVGNVVYIAITECVFVVKLLNMWYFLQPAWLYMHEVECNVAYVLHNAGEREFWQRKQRVFRFVAIAYIVASALVIITASVGAVLSPEYELPFPAWVPFDWRNAENYLYAYVPTTLCMTITCISNTTLDMIYCYFLFHLALLFQLIGERLVALNRWRDEATALHELDIIFRLHQHVNRLTLTCETLISAPFLAQIILSALVLCFSGYRLLTVGITNNISMTLATLQYLSVMTLQIYLPCHYGNEVQRHSNELMNSAYATKWFEYSTVARKLICLYMESLKRPARIRAGSFFEVSLPVFSKTMNNAYSFFAVLLKMSQK